MRVGADDGRAVSEFGDRAGSLSQRRDCEPPARAGEAGELVPLLPRWREQRLMCVPRIPCWERFVQQFVFAKVGALVIVEQWLILCKQQKYC